MKNIKTILLFVLTNITIVAMLNVVIYLLSLFFGRDIYSSQSTIVSLSIFAVVFGFGGAFINLLISKRIAKRIYSIHPISAHAHGREKLMYDTITLLSSKHNIKRPELGIYESEDPNAFATGPNKDNSLIALSTGLLDEMTDEELKGVLGHEFAHIINGDMVKMTLLQGVINAFVMFLSRIIAWGIDIAMKKDDEEGGLGGFAYFILVFGLDVLLGFVGMLVLMAYSRKREFVADEGSSELLGKECMIKALEKLKHLSERKKGESTRQDEFSTLKISGGKDILRLFSSHPSLDDRIKYLKNIK